MECGLKKTSLCFSKSAIRNPHSAIGSASVRGSFTFLSVGFCFLFRCGLLRLRIEILFAQAREGLTDGRIIIAREFGQPEFPVDVRALYPPCDESASAISSRAERKGTMPTPMSASTICLIAASRLNSIATVGFTPASANNSSIKRRVLPPRSPKISFSPASANALTTRCFASL